jgi:hypothetical protein
MGVGGEDLGEIYLGMVVVTKLVVPVYMFGIGMLLRVKLVTNIYEPIQC